MSDDMPIDPISELAAGMMGFHEFYSSAVQAGFSPEQAFVMTLELLRAGLARG